MKGRLILKYFLADPPKFVKNVIFLSMGQNFKHENQIIPCAKYVVNLLHINVYGHITLNTPVLIQSLKFSKVELCYRVQTELAPYWI